MAQRLVPVEQPHHYPTNRIITRGMGPMRNNAIQRAGLATRGYGGQPPAFVVESFRQINLGQSGTKRRLAELDEIIVWAKLIELNGVEPKRLLRGWIRVRVDSDRGYSSVMAEHVSVRVRKALEFISVTARRLDT